MPYDDPDATDPQELVGVVLPGGPEEMREMAYVFAEEFARMGHTGRQIVRMFQNPFYAGANGAYRALGHDAIAAMVDECVNVWGRVQILDQDACTPNVSRLPSHASRSREE